MHILYCNLISEVSYCCKIKLDILSFQVLPDRTHPEVTMNASSGFLLSGYVLK